MSKQPNPVPSHRRRKQSSGKPSSPSGRPTVAAGTCCWALVRTRPSQTRVRTSRLAELSCPRSTVSAATDLNGPRPTVNEVARLPEHAERHYRHPDGTPDHRIVQLPQDALQARARTLRPPGAAKFGPLALKAVRQRMVEGGLCRPVVNRRSTGVRRVFKWAVGEELIPPSVIEGLRCVTGLQRAAAPTPGQKQTCQTCPRHIRGCDRALRRPERVGDGRTPTADRHETR